MTAPATQSAPGPEGETIQFAVGLTGAQAHDLREPEPVHEREPEPAREPEPSEVGEGQPEPLPALVLPDLRPYADPKAVIDVARRGIKASRRPARGAVRHVAAGVTFAVRPMLAGTAALLGLLVGWLTGEYGKNGSRMARLGGVAAVLLGIVHTVAEYPVEGVLGILWAWVMTGFAHRTGALDRLLRKARGEKKDSGKTASKPVEEVPAKAADDAPKRHRKGLADWLRKKPAKAADDAPDQPLDGTPGEQPEQPPAEVPAEPPLTALIRELIGDENGVHLAVLRPAMRERLPGLAKATDKQLRERLVEAGFDPSKTFRARGVAGRAGVHRNELPPAPSPESGPEEERNDSPHPESGSDQAISPPALRRSPGAESGGERRQKLPEGWTAEEVARGFRTVDDPDAGPTAARVERLKDVG